MSTTSGNEALERERIWMEVFDLFDKDKNGTICKKELHFVLNALSLDPTKKELEEAMQELDRDGNGIINFNDFKLYMTKMKTSTFDERRDDLLKAFQLMDKNGDHHLDSNELYTVLTSLGEPLTEQEAEAMIKVADCNNDGKIDYEEFVDFILSPYACPISSKPSKKVQRRNTSKSLAGSNQCSMTSQGSTSSQQGSGFFYTAEKNNSSMNNYLSATDSDVSMTTPFDDHHSSMSSGSGSATAAGLNKYGGQSSGVVIEDTSWGGS